MQFITHSYRVYIYTAKEYAIYPTYFSLFTGEAVMQYNLHGALLPLLPKPNFSSSFIHKR